MAGPKPLRGFAGRRTRDPQGLRRSGKQFDQLGRKEPSSIDLEEQITAQEAQITSLAARITELENASKASGES